MNVKDYKQTVSFLVRSMTEETQFSGLMFPQVVQKN